MTILKQTRHKLGVLKYSIRRRIWATLKDKSSEIQVNTKQGRFFVSTRDNAIGGQLYSARQFDLYDMREVTNFLRRERLLEGPAETLLLDVGANMGVICVGMVHDGLAGKSIAIEAEPYNVDLLRRNIALNGLESTITPVHCAVSEEDGFANLEINPVDNMGDHRVASVGASQGEKGDGGHVVVPTRRLDDVVREHNGGQIPGPRRCLTWLDIQAHELFALRGARDLMASGNPLYVEIWPAGLDEWGGGAKQFADLVAEYWSEFVRFENGTPVRHPVGELPRIFDQIGYVGQNYDNVLLIRP